MQALRASMQQLSPCGIDVETGIIRMFAIVLVVCEVLELVLPVVRKEGDCAGC